MATPSLARNFYDQIVNNPDPFMAIRRLVNSNPPTLESDHFDCKLEHQDQKQREKKSKELWSEVLGGFANGGGGVLIWGLDARKHKIDGREIDAVCGEELIANPRALEARLRELQRQATDPPLGGVEIMAIPVQDDDSEGFVICFIPDGPFKPYRSEQAGQQYYIRAGDTTQVMPRSVLSAMFFPRYNAVFNVRAELTYKQYCRPGSAGSRHGYPVSSSDEITCLMELSNQGTATARGIFGRLRWRIPGEKENFKVIGGDCWSNGDSECSFMRSFPIHPGMGAIILSASWRIEHKIIDQNANRGFVFGDTPPSIGLSVFCENHQPQTITLQFDLKELVTNEKLELVSAADS